MVNLNNIGISKHNEEAILKAELFVLSQFDVPRKDIHSNKRTEDVVVARYVIYYILSEVFKFPLVYIGKLFNRSHPSVLSGVKKVEEWGWRDKVLNEFVEMFPSYKDTVDKSVENPV